MAHRRRWSEAAIVCKSFEPGEVVSIVAVLYIVNPERLSQWRKRYREGRLSVRKA
ncbi:transposase [Burkholderia ubonensis]|uniref:transposase n=1 Tax=Burkholderia ubonensis TaxID=101571 RepID=UPI0039F4A97C